MRIQGGDPHARSPGPRLTEPRRATESPAYPCAIRVRLAPMSKPDALVGNAHTPMLQK
jgi:hypothetical protein